MENKVNYSIIIPHYNIPDLLRRCLRSIPERDDTQVIVVDDQSDDRDTYHYAVPELHRKNVEFHVVDKKNGAGHARNVGLKYAKGKWLIFADADDFFSDEFNDILNEYVNEPEDVMFFNTQSCYSNDISVTFQRSYDVLFENYRKTSDRRWFSICYPQPWGKIVSHRLVVENSITFQETIANNDLLFSIKTGTLAKSIKVVDRLLYWYTFRKGSLTSSIKKEPLTTVFDRIKAYYASQRFLEENNVKVNFPLHWIPIKGFLPFDIQRFRHCLEFMKCNKMETQGFLYRSMVSCLRYPFVRLRLIRDKGLYDLIS